MKFYKNGILIEVNDFTTAEKNKLASLENYDDTVLSENVEDAKTAAGTANENALAAQTVAEAAQQTANSKVDKEEGKGLSTNDFTTELKTKLEGLSNYDDTALKQYVDGKLVAVYRIKPAVATKSALPTEDNTLGDVRDVQDSGKNYVWTENGWDDLGGTFDVSDKVDKEEGKGLSTNDYTTAEKTKLSNIKHIISSYTIDEAAGTINLVIEDLA